MRIVALLSLAACWTSDPPPAPARPEPPPRTRRIAYTPACANDPETRANARAGYDCAAAALAAGDYATAEELATLVHEHFPYSKYAVTAELIHADVLAAKKDYAGAVEAYETWLRYHPSNEHRDEVFQKRDRARDHAP